ncbi:MAG: bacterioferritin [Rhodospirillales bacterium]|nr:bacterioferritin [Rhodospirillales bacterium]
MDGDKDIIKHLNGVLKNELTAINQYFLHSRMLEDWGFDCLAQKLYRESIEEMEHADALIKRILLIKGLPNLQDLGRLRIGESIEEIMTCDLALEQEAIPQLREAIALCEQKSDYVSRSLLVSILDDEEEHEDWIETQIGLIEKMGIQNYTQSQMSAEE